MVSLHRETNDFSLSLVSKLNGQLSIVYDGKAQPEKVLRLASSCLAALYQTS